MSSATQLSKWLEKQANVIESTGGLTRVRLFQVQAGRQAVQLEQWAFSDDSPCKADDVAIEILEAAQTDADAMAGGLQRYTLRCYYGEKEEHSAQKSFNAGKRMNDDDFGGTEPPTMLGQRAQAMRHTEGLHALILKGMGAIQDGMRRDLQEIRAHSAEQQRVLWQQEAELMALRRADRADQIQHEEHQMRMKQMETVYGIAMSLAPALLGKVLGSGGGGPSPNEVALKSFLNDLTVQEQMGIMEALSDGKKVRLIQMLKHFQAEEQQASEQKH